MSLTQSQSIRIANDVEAELKCLASYDNSITAAGVVSGFRNVALDLKQSVAQLPTGLWQLFSEFDRRPPATVFSVDEVIKRVRRCD